MTRPLVLLLDTNVWLDYLYGDRNPEAHACELLRQAASAEAELLIAAHSLKDCFYLVRQDHKRRNFKDERISSESAVAVATEIAWACIDVVKRLATVVASDCSDSDVACKFRAVHADYEDNLVVAAALRSHADYLVTNDKRLLAHSPVPTIDAASACELLK